MSKGRQKAHLRRKRLFLFSLPRRTDEAGKEKKIASRPSVRFRSFFHYGAEISSHSLPPLFLGERTQPHFLSRESHATNCEIGSPHAAVGAVQLREGAVREVLGLAAAIEVTLSPSKVFTHVRAGDISLM